MSRTDVHRPIRVMQHDPYVRHWFADFHHHTDGLCDLDKFLASPHWIRTNCYRQLWTQAPNVCGCEMCTGQTGRKLARRQERTRWRTIRQALLATVDLDDVDVPPIRGKGW